MNFSEQLTFHCNRIPKKTALVWKEGSITYKQLDESVNQFANGIISLGVKPGDRVAIQLLNCSEFVVSYLGIIRAGGIVVPINPLYKAGELEVIMEDCHAGILITASSFVSSIKASVKNLSTLTHLIICEKKGDPCLNNHESQCKDWINASQNTVTLLTWQDFLSKQPSSHTNVPLDNDNTCEIIYTSGTTGRPKGAMLTHNNLYQNAKVFADSLKLSQDERTLIVAPAFHAAAQTCCQNATLVVGGTSYLLERWTSVEDTLTAMQNWQISYFFGPPTMYAFILAHPNLSTYKLNLRFAFTGAASLPVEIFQKWLDTFGFAIVEGYGLSETSPVATFNPPYGEKKPGSIGTAMEGIEVRVFNEKNEEAPLGEVGELVIRGHNVMQGYWNNQIETSLAIKNGWFHTGDMAYQDKDGYFFIVDRKKDMINRGGMKVYPREVEEVIYSYPGVMEAAVIGIPDHIMGEEIKAFVTIKEGHSMKPNDIISFCAEKIAHFKVPKQVQILKSLPKTVSGKIIKTELRTLE